MSTVEIARTPIDPAVATDDSACGHEIATEPMASPEAKDFSAPSPTPSPAPRPGTRAVERPAQGNTIAPPVAPSRTDSRGISGDGWATLRIWAEMFFDVQKSRIGCSNRMQRGGVVSAEYESQIHALAIAEKEMQKGLVRCYRRVVPAPIVAWQKSALGIGEHSLARLLGQLGHPAIAEPYHWEESDGEHKRVLVADAPYARSLRQLWAYCGHGDPARRRRVGMSQDDALAGGSVLCKMIVHQLLATACVKNTASPYRAAYDARREQTADRDGWTLGHQHNDALRIVGKEILRDLWLASQEQTA